MPISIAFQNHPVCFLKAAYHPLGDLLRNEIKFKENTKNSRIHDMLLKSHVYLKEECFKIKADESQVLPINQAPSSCNC